MKVVSQVLCGAVRGLTLTPIVIHCIHEDAANINPGSGSRLKEVDSTGKEGRAPGIGPDSTGDSAVSK